ncbi:hypothetical protein SGLAM104S_00848 [Streptomyces glaucescens]
MKPSAAPGARTSNSQDGTSVCRASTKCEASPKTASSTTIVSRFPFPGTEVSHGACARSSSSGTGLAQPPMPTRWPGSWAAFSRSSVRRASSTGYVAPFTGVFSWPLPVTTSPCALTVSPVGQPYVGSPPTTGSAVTTRSAPFTWEASTRAESWPSAFSTGAAALRAAASPTGSTDGDAGALAQTVTLSQSSVPGAYRWNVQVPGACRFTWRLGPWPSLPDPTFQACPSATGVPSTPSAAASRVTSASVTSPFAQYTGAEPGPFRSAPDAW